MGAAPYYDDEELAALGRRPRPSALDDTDGTAGKRQAVRLVHDPLCSSSGAVDGYRCDECAVIIRTRIDAMRRQRELDRMRARAAHPAGRARGVRLGEQLELWGDF